MAQIRETKCLSESERHDVAVFLIAKSNEGKLDRGVLKEAAAKWHVHRTTITKIWKIAKPQSQAGEPLNVNSKRMGNSNRKRILPDHDFIKGLDVEFRDTMDRLAKAVGCSVGTVHSWVDEGLVKAHSSSLHPMLTDPNKIERLKFALNSIGVTHSPDLGFEINFKDMDNIIHIDEKWFYITKPKHKFYVVPGEKLPYRACKSKRYITKVMFMCAVCRPIYNEQGEMIFDGKIGMFPFTEEVPAARRSKNRPAGTMETKPIDSITRQVTKACIIKQIIPAIKRLWPENASKHIYIQQDNAKPHIKNNDPDFLAAATSDGFNIEFMNQPPNSPDLNVNDLGFFSALQSIQSQRASRNVVELVDAVMKAFTEYSPTKLNKIFLTLQSVMLEVMKAHGHNNFSIPHMQKDHLTALGLLPRNLKGDEAVVRECIQFLQGAGNTIGLEQLLNDLGYNNEGEEVVGAEPMLV